MKDITYRLTDFIEVFGSNELGIHGSGHARHCATFRGAVRGQGFGLQGESFALPTKSAPRQDETLPMDKIADYWSAFLDVAKNYQGKPFLVARIGCGLAGLSDKDMIDMLYKGPAVPSNVYLPYIWEKTLNPDTTQPRIIVAGSRGFEDKRLLDQELSRRIEQLVSQGLPNPMIISGEARGADRMGRNYALRHGLDLLRMPAEWDFFGKKAAGSVRNQHMAWAGTHVLAFWDGSSRGTANMIETGKRDRLKVATVL